MKKILWLLLALCAITAVAQEREYCPSMLEDGNEWSYYINYTERTDEGLNRYVFFYHFYLDGTSEINGRTYHNVCCEWDEVAKMPYCFKGVYEDKVVRHLREEGMKILAPISDFIDIGRNPFMGEQEGDECIIYNWNWENEKIGYLVYQHGGYEEYADTYIDKYEAPFATLDGLKRKMWNVRNYGDVIEGIGSINNPGMLTHHLDDYDIPMGYLILGKSHLNVFVQNGKVVYKAPDYTGDPEKQDEDYTTYKPDPYLGELVEASFVSSTIIPASSPTYDLSGRKTSSPTARGIYIEGGKKVVR